MTHRRRLLGLLVAFALLAVACSGSSNSSSDLLDNTGDGLSVQPVDDGIETDDGSDTAVSAIPITYFDGTTGTLADFSGRPTVVNFFASWCAPCRAELPHFESTFKTWGDEVNFVGIATNDDRTNALDLIEETGITFEILDDPNQELFFALDGFSMPTTIFLDADGSVVETRVGVILEEELETKVADLAA